jgi:glycosyltransferase involved in cell wall biosynthesis
VAAIISAMNEEETIPELLRQLERLPFHEVIFVVNGSRDRTFSLVREHPRAIILHYAAPLGHDVGRAIGARVSSADILLFLDADMMLSAEQWVPFVHAIDQGMDVALNDVNPYLGTFNKRDHVSMMKEFLNRSLRRKDLGAASLTAVPHAMSAEAARRIGHSNLSVPPKAHVIALQSGLRVGKVAGVDVFTRNRLRSSNTGERNTVAEMIIGDHVEALLEVMRSQGKRLSFPDEIRRREICGP